MIDVKNLKKQIDIVEVVKSYADLEKIGKNYYKTNCPLPHHNDKTPSFYIRGDEQYFKCFGCSYGGDVISFIEEVEGIDFTDALEKLIEENGIKVSKKQKTIYTLDEDLTLEKINQMINLYNERKTLSEDLLEKYNQNLPRYFIDLGFSKETLEYFEVGFCCDANDDLYNRATIPWRDAYGNLITFNARDITDNSDKKYKYKKGTSKVNIIYNLNNIVANNLLNRNLLLTEGEKDVWRLHEYGYENAVALGGSAIGDRKWLLRKYTNKVTLAFDNDETGNKAKRKIAKCLYPLMNVYAVKLPKGKDFGDIQDKELVDKILNNTVKYKGGG